jgi:5S rRNA maturation endonuclease (ribonuclease M5)
LFFRNHEATPPEGPHTGTKSDAGGSARLQSFEGTEADVERMQCKLVKNPWVQAYIESRGISIRVATDLQWGAAKRKFRNEQGRWVEKTVLAVPHYREGLLVGIKFKTIDGTKLFSQMPGSSTQGLYGLGHLDPKVGEVLILEGPEDAALAISHGFNAVAINSADSGPLATDIAALRRYPRVFLIGDQDSAGQRAIDALQQLLPPEHGIRIQMPEFKDIGELYAASPAEFGDTLSNRLAAARGNKGGRNATGATVKENDAPHTGSAALLSIADMPVDALDGRLGEICQRRMARFPMAYAWPAIVTAAGTTIETPNGKSLRTNLFCGLVGPVDSGKSQAIECAIGALGLAEPRLQNLMSGSAEGLLSKLSSANGEPRLVSPDELGHLLSKSHIENASFPFVLNRAYYQTRFEQTSARGKVIEFNCSLSFIGGVVDTDFGHLFDFATVGGLHDRFIFGLCPDSFSFVYRPFEGASEASNISPVAVTVDSEVWEAKDEWLRTIPNLSGRCAEHALRLAGICASFDGRKRLRAADLRPARAFAESQARVRLILRPNPGENSDAKCAFAIMAALQRQAPESQWVNRRSLYRQIHAERHGAGVFNRALINLQYNGEIELPDKTGLRLLP